MSFTIRCSLIIHILSDTRFSENNPESLLVSLLRVKGVVALWCSPLALQPGQSCGLGSNRYLIVYEKQF